MIQRVLIMFTMLNRTTVAREEPDKFRNSKRAALKSLAAEHTIGTFYFSSLITSISAFSYDKHRRLEPLSVSRYAQGFSGEELIIEDTAGFAAGAFNPG